MKLPRIVGVAGTNGSGKDTLGDLLSIECQYNVVSLSDLLREELTRQNKPHTRKNLSGLSAQIRQVEGDGAMTNRVIQTYDTSEKGLCITSIRTPGEAQAVKDSGGVMIWVDADPSIRYQRVVSGVRGRLTDTVSFEEFIRQEEAELTPTVAGGGLNMASVKKISDRYLENNFATLEEYKQFLREYFEF
jgi:dephospho-CoA kinase